MYAHVIPDLDRESRSRSNGTLIGVFRASEPMGPRRIGDEDDNG